MGSASLCALATPLPTLALNFTNVTSAAGFIYAHGYSGPVGEARLSAGGVAVGDYDRDGWEDVYVVRGNIGPNLLFRNLGNGTFQEVGASAGVNISGAYGSGPTFGDYDGDGWLDLIIGGADPTQPRLFRNLGTGAFADVTPTCGISTLMNTFSCTYGDYDIDGDLDLFLTHWGPIGSPDHLWRNNGNGSFTSVDWDAGLSILGDEGADYSYTGNFADINDDGFPDLLVAADFERSKVFINDGDGTFTNVTTGVISDENGMGGAVGDYDNDGDLDWFVSSIWDPNGVPEGSWGITGNRLYRNAGGGVFQDVTTATGVRQGYWGWGSSFADFNNDGHLDLVHVNGWNALEFERDSTRVFISGGDATFTEQSYVLGVRDVGQGRGVACFDYDRDGDLDIFIANNGSAPLFYRNDGGNALKYLSVRLAGPSPNTEGIGARVFVTAGGVTQMREIRCGSNYVSQDPAVAHFGLGSATLVSELRVEWPDGVTTVLNGLAPNQRLVLDQNVTGVSPGSGSTPLGSAFELVGGAPNPFGASTTIRFRLPHRADVSLRVYSLAGRHVATLVDESREPGEHGVDWDGRDGAGRLAAAGPYVVRLESAAGAVSTRLILAR
ncbi:MAG: FG-GAP-like repeat-containing protein [bacterium]